MIQSNFMQFLKEKEAPSRMRGGYKFSSHSVLKNPKMAELVGEGSFSPFSNGLKAPQWKLQPSSWGIVGDEAASLSLVR